MQDEDQSQQIITLLKQYSDDGLKFEEAKDKLLSQGFSDADISDATDNYQYGEKQVSDIPTQVTQYFNEHPEKGLKDGASLLKAVKQDERTEDRTKAILDFGAERAAGEFGPMGIDEQVGFGQRFSYDVGIPYWVFVTIGVAVNVIALAVVIFLRLNGWFYIINGVLSLAVVIFLIWRTDR